MSTKPPTQPQSSSRKRSRSPLSTDESSASPPPSKRQKSSHNPKDYKSSSSSHRNRDRRSYSRRDRDRDRPPPPRSRDRYRGGGPPRHHNRRSSSLSDAFSRDKLPIDDCKEDILKLVHENDVVIITGDTGSGKSTQLSQFLFNDSYRRIVVTQPRRVGAISLAMRVSREMGTEVGGLVG